MNHVIQIKQRETSKFFSHSGILVDDNSIQNSRWKAPLLQKKTRMKTIKNKKIMRACIFTQRLQIGLGSCEILMNKWSALGANLTQWFLLSYDHLCQWIHLNSWRKKYDVYDNQIEIKRCRSRKFFYIRERSFYKI